MGNASPLTPRSAIRVPHFRVRVPNSTPLCPGDRRQRQPAADPGGWLGNGDRDCGINFEIAAAQVEFCDIYARPKPEIEKAQPGGLVLMKDQLVGPTRGTGTDIIRDRQDVRVGSETFEAQGAGC